MKFGLGILTATAIFAGIATAQDINPAVQARMDIMKQLKDGFGPLGGMAKGSVAYDAATAQDAIAKLIDASAKISDAFAANETDPKSEALPAIWENMDDFKSKAEDLAFALEAWDVSSLENIQAGMGNVGAACGACHKEYRMKK